MAEFLVFVYVLAFVLSLVILGLIIRFLWYVPSYLRSIGFYLSLLHEFFISRED